MKCPKCKHEFDLDAKTAKFCPSCGAEFRQVTETITMRPTTMDGDPIMIIDTKALEHTPENATVPPSERWMGDHLEQELANPDGYSYIPEDAVTYDTEGGQVISHRQIQTVKPVKIPSAIEQEKDFMRDGCCSQGNRFKYRNCQRGGFNRYQRNICG